MELNGSQHPWASVLTFSQLEKDLPRRATKALKVPPRQSAEGMKSPIVQKPKAKGLPKHAKEPKAPTNKSPSAPKSRGHRKHHRAKTEGIENLRNDDSNVPHSSKNAKGGWRFANKNIAHSQSWDTLKKQNRGGAMQNINGFTKYIRIISIMNAALRSRKRGWHFATTIMRPRRDINSP